MYMATKYWVLETKLWPQIRHSLARMNYCGWVVFLSFQVLADKLKYA